MAASAVVFEKPYSTEEKDSETEIKEWVACGIVDAEANVESEQLAGEPFGSPLHMLVADAVEHDVDCSTHNGNAERNPEGRKHPEPRPSNVASELEDDEDEGEGLKKADASSGAGR